MKVTAHVLRVFVNKDGAFGNPVGIVLDDTHKILSQDRQKIATALNFSETVFVNNQIQGIVTLFNPQEEVAFAGHAFVGASWFLSRSNNTPVKFLECKENKIGTWWNDGFTWIRGKLSTTPDWNYEQLQSAEEVESFSGGSSREHTMVWAWVDENKGIVRARTFAPDWGIAEDQANGSGSMKLSAKLKRELDIYHGEGSVIYAKPYLEDFADVGGRVVEDVSQDIQI